MSSNKWILIVILLGIILVGFGTIYAKGANIFKNTSIGGTRVEVLNATTGIQETPEITVEIAGEVEKPGVYKLVNGSRVEDLLVVSGGLSENANREWTDKYLNRASKLTDGQKVYIPKQSESLTATNIGVDQNISPQILGQGSGLTNINTSSLSELDKLPGIGPVYGQSIIDHRPYSNIEELVSKGAIKKNVFEKIKDKVSVY